MTWLLTMSVKAESFTAKINRNLAADGTLGDAWYRGFMTHHKEVLTNKQRTVKMLREEIG